jgi:hypothetical protein
MQLYGGAAVAAWLMLPPVWKSAVSSIGRFVLSSVLETLVTGSTSPAPHAPAGVQQGRLLRGREGRSATPALGGLRRSVESAIMAYSIKHGTDQNAPSERRETATACLERVKELQSEREREIKVYDRVGAEITVIELERLSGKELI